VKISFVLLWVGVAGLTGCASEGAPPSASSSESSPLITNPHSGGGTPVTLSGYVDTSASTEVK
jgi:hypothetical protein